MKTLILLITAVTNDYYTTIDGQIYYTPIIDCPNCAASTCEIIQEDRWIRVTTDRIFLNKFEVNQ
jgi:hypothetical protein